MRFTERDPGAGRVAPPEDDEATRTIARLGLDDVLEAARAGGLDAALARLVRSLAGVKASVGPRTWSRVLAAARAHPLRGFLHLDPFTLRCYARPGGQAGDAAALDYALRPRELSMPLSDPVAALHQWMIRGQTARALRYRRDCLARAIEEAAEKCDRPPRILAAGCGHLRECDGVLAFGTKRIGRIIALDADPDALERVRRDYASLPVVAHVGSVRDLVRGADGFADMDLVYCSGLMESLPQEAAAALARSLFSALRPGGTLVVTQFLAGLAEAAFLEVYMDWHMTYRTKAEAMALVEPLLPETALGCSYQESPEATLCAISLQRR